MCRVLCDTITARLARFPIKLHHYRIQSYLDRYIKQAYNPSIIISCIYSDKRS
jgi:hypothetical protein